MQTTTYDQTEKSFWRESDSLGKLIHLKQHTVAFETDLPTECDQGPAFPKAEKLLRLRHTKEARLQAVVVHWRQMVDSSMKKIRNHLR
jgi:hypothetical protein